MLDKRRGHQHLLGEHGPQRSSPPGFYPGVNCSHAGCGGYRWNRVFGVRTAIRLRFRGREPQTGQRMKARIHAPVASPTQRPLVLPTHHPSTIISTTLRREGAFPRRYCAPARGTRMKGEAYERVNRVSCLPSLPPLSAPSYLSGHLKEEAPVRWYSVSLSFFFFFFHQYTHTPVT